MKKSVEMKRVNRFWETETGHCPLCCDAVSKLLDIGRARSVFMMLSDKKPRHDHYWKIKKPQDSGRVIRSCFREYEGTTDWAADRYLYDHYRQGYLYVWAEVWA